MGEEDEVTVLHSNHIDKPVTSAVIELRVHNHYQVSTDPQPPAQAARDHKQLDGSRCEQLLHNLALQIGESLVEICNTTRQCFNERLH